MKCQKCGYDNLKGVTKCGKCGQLLNFKSCPKCATKNDYGVVKCEKCGYMFEGRSLKRIIFSLIITIIVMALLVVFLFIDKNWPDFNEKDLYDAIEVYRSRNRKFGAK